MSDFFFKNTAETKFIKNLISHVNIPSYSTIEDDRYVISDMTYIYKDSLIQCLKTGKFNHKDIYSYKIIQPYVFGDYYPQFTYRYNSMNSYYDSETHYHLGQYLRCLRDIKGIDLMPFYNCFNHKYISDIRLNIDKPYIDISSDPNIKVLAIPIKFNQLYTIALDSSDRLLMKAIIYDDLGQITKTTSRATKEYYTDDLSDSTQIYTNCSFKEPLYYEIKTDSKQLLQYEKYLYLCIQLPASSKSSICVLEGKYNSNVSEKIFSKEGLNQFSSNMMNRFYLHNLSLLQLNTHVSHACSEKLISYLLNNVITEREDLAKNIQRVEEHLDVPVTRVWTNSLRDLIYNNYLRHESITYDINGYVDVDIEKALMSGKMKVKHGNS